MIKANIVIVDSGLDKCFQEKNNVVGGKCFKKVITGKIDEKDNYDDAFGHGTAVFSIANKKCRDATFFILKIFDNSPVCDQELLIHSLKYIYRYIKCDFILLSSGAVRLYDVNEFQIIAKALYEEKESIIISAFNNDGALSYPAADDYVIGVDSSYSVIPKDNYYIIKGSPVDILSCYRSYRVDWLNGQKLVQKGNSYLAADFLSKFFEAYRQTKSKKKSVLLQSIKTQNNEIIFKPPCFEQLINPSFLSKKNKLRAIAFPFSKEIKVLAANEDMLCVDIVGYYDVRESGKVGLNISDLLGYSSNGKKVKNIYDLDLEEQYDLIICGHLDLLNQITIIDWKDKFKRLARLNNKYLYLFDYDIDRKEDIIYSPPNIQKYNGYSFGKLWQVCAPVLGIFGTSSTQGKFSLQLKLRRAFIENGYFIKQISTEPSGPLFGMDYVCPIGYNSSFDLTGNDAAKFYNQIIHECDKNNPDLILVGSQSATLPHNCYNAQYFTFPQIEFLFGTNPDAVILLINEFDDVAYVKRSIDFIESAVHTKVICCVISPVKRNNAHDNGLPFINDLGTPVFDYNTQFDAIYQSIIDYFGG